MKYKKIALIGMMGSGKSTVSKFLAKKLNCNLIELDKIFEIQEKMSIKDFFKEFGEKKFRTIESEILKAELKKENIVVSTGGGIILKEENRNILFEKDIFTIYLKTGADVIYNRIKNDKARPLLQSENPKKEIENILKAREKFYNLAKITIETDNKTIEEIFEEIKQWIK